MNATPATPETVAAKFLELLRDELGDAAYRTACERNADEPNDAVCHSHDFCDANMVMLAAFEDLGLADPNDADEALHCDDALWCDGWNLATDQMKREAVDGGAL